LQNPLTNSLAPGVGVTTYKEIPIGTLTENLLARLSDSCYGFDSAGNPVAGEEITTDNGEKMAGPTYISLDRTDCLLKLVDGAQKKAQVIALLSSEITKLMNQCDCQGKCDNTCQGTELDENGQSKGCNQPTQCPVDDPNQPGLCSGKCVGAGCKTPVYKDAPKDCCPKGVKDKIEQGPIFVGGGCDNSANECDMCSMPETMYAGLNEFRCPNPTKGVPYTACDNIANAVEKQVQLNKKTITVIDPKKWNKLNLAQQLSYFKEKINLIKQEIKKDADQLSQAKTALGNCYSAIPYIDLLKTYQSTDQSSKIIYINKTFKDPKTNSPVDVSKYCKGFNYGNSDCLKKCNNMCPDTSNEAIKLFQACENCRPGDQDCLSRQELCIEKAYNDKPCAQKDSSQNYSNFGECIDSCKTGCADICSKEYMPESSGYKTCQEQCNSNSRCVLDNAESCLFGSQAFVDCAKQGATDQANIQRCFDKAYLCKNGSDEYAGYPDCVNLSTRGCLASNYSSSFLYKSFIDSVGNNLGCEKCPYPYESVIEGGPACQDLYPETAKCPSSSKCPACPCDEAKNNISFCIPNESNEDNAGNEGGKLSSQRLSAYEITSSECNEYSFNDDPLTFYCQDSWWLDPNKPGSDPEPIGTKRICPEQGEVPVGQTVDSAGGWAGKIIEEAEKINKSINQVLDKMSKAGKAKNLANGVQNYCKCEAKFDGTKKSGPICKTDCKFNQTEAPIYDTDGNDTGATETVCSCAFTSCQGSPCQQVVSYLSEVWNSYRQFKTDFADFYAVVLSDSKSDIIKQLSYSRSTANTCSLVNSAYGSNAKLLNCTWVEHQMISPISNGQIIFDGVAYDGCYGGQENGHLGKINNLTDNWFCCQEYQK
jgi:hypothetical protein